MLQSLLLLLFIVVIVLLSPYAYNASHSSSPKIIQGKGFGNNGLRFESFASCSNGVQFFHQMDISFYSLVTSNHNKNPIIGIWAIQFKSNNTNQDLIKAGYIVNSTYHSDVYNLIGKEVIDSVCGSPGNIITIMGECKRNTPIQYSTDNGERVGSITPPKGLKVFHLHASEINCI